HRRRPALGDRHGAEDLRAVGGEMVVEQIDGAAGDPALNQLLAQRLDGGVPGGRSGLAEAGDEEGADTLQILLVAADIASPPPLRPGPSAGRRRRRGASGRAGGWGRSRGGGPGGGGGGSLWSSRVSRKMKSCIRPRGLAPVG